MKLNTTTTESFRHWKMSDFFSQISPKWSRRRLHMFVFRDARPRPRSVNKGRWSNSFFATTRWSADRSGTESEVSYRACDFVFNEVAFFIRQFANLNQLL